MTLVQECWGMIIENNLCCHLLPKKILYDYWFVIGVSLGSSVGFGEVNITRNFMAYEDFGAIGPPCFLRTIQPLFLKYFEMLGI